MNRFAIPSVLAAVLAAAGTVHADHYQQSLPLKLGNEWTYYRSFARYTAKVDGKGQTIFHVNSFPGFPKGAWLAWSGSTLYVWSSSKSAWVAFLKFGVATGTTYAVTIDTPYWNNTQVTLKSKSVLIYDAHLGANLGPAYQFAFSSPSISNFSSRDFVTEYVFSKGWGLVRWTEGSIYGPITSLLAAGNVNGYKIGPIPSKKLANGNYSSYPLVTGTNLVLVLTTQEDWLTMWAKHSPYTQPPSVDFSKQTVVAIFLGKRETEGYSVALTGAWWAFPSNTLARLRVTEIVPGAGISVPLRPFAIYVLNAKVTLSSYQWQVLPKL